MIQTANDSPERDPVDWTVNGDDRQVIHTIKGEEPRGRF